MTRRPSQSERLAESLRDDPPELDDVARVRMERALLEARRAGAGVSKRGPGFAWGLGLGIAAAAAIFLVWRAASPAPHASAPSASLAKGAGVTARIERWQGGERVDAGGLREGMRVLTGELERARLSLGRSRIELSPDSLLVPERMQSDVRMRLERGEVRVEFNPEHPGQEGFVLETESARVEVVGTAFRVRVAADGSTDVTVE
ncbi:MAG: FecR domain-containing protein, partial [Myxococcales bacterium]|nr:FecR domain-containing protein [Myxococcales bacterium]